MDLGLFRKIILLALVSGLTLVHGQAKKGGGMPGGAGGRAVMPHPRPVERLSEMTPEEREKELERLPPARRQKLKRQLERYQNMPEQERARIQRQFDAFRQLPPEQQQTVRK